MSFDPQYLDLMRSTATFKPYSSEDGWGTPSFGGTVTFRCHITQENKIVRGDTEEAADSTAQMETPPPGYVISAVATPTFTTADQITMPDTTTRRILSVQVFYDEDGSPHSQYLMLT